MLFMLWLLSCILLKKIIALLEVWYLPISANMPFPPEIHVDGGHVGFP